MGLGGKNEFKDIVFVYTHKLSKKKATLQIFPCNHQRQLCTTVLSKSDIQGNEDLRILNLSEHSMKTKTPKPGFKYKFV
jgi:hypothetical protein